MLTSSPMSPTSDARLRSGDRFDDYRIEGLIANGGMGQVYLARHLVYGQRVALKVLHPSLEDDPAWRARLQEEGEVGMRLKHPNILSAREIVFDNHRPALVLDLSSEGQTLGRIVSREYRDGLPLLLALDLFLQILWGMEYLHTQRIVHGDVKPDNVLIEGSWRDPRTWVPRVTDFGTVALIARPMQIDGRPAVVATPAYASPEHMCGVDQIEVRSDIYCLGLLLHYLLTGRHASNAQNVREAADRVALPVPILHLVDSPPEVIQLFLGMVAQNARERYESIRGVALVVRAVREQLAGVADDPDGYQGSLQTVQGDSWSTSYVPPALQTVRTTADLADLTVHPSELSTEGAVPRRWAAAAPAPPAPVRPGPGLMGRARAALAAATRVFRRRQRT